LSGTTLIVPDSIVEVNGNAEGLIKAVKPIDVKVINSGGPVGIVSVDVDDNEVIIELSSSCADSEVTLDGVPLVTVSSGGAEDVQLVNQDGATITPTSISGGVIEVDMTFPCSGIGGYKGSQPYYTLPSNNACGHAFRFCGRTGGYYSGSGYFDKNGVATTKALAFPLGIIYDTYGVTCDGNLLVFQDQFLLTGLVTLAGAVAFCESFSLGGYSDWIQMNRDHYDQIRNNDTQYVLDQPPFSNPYFAVELWLNTTFPIGGTDTRAWKLSVYGGEDFAYKTVEAGRAFPVRIGNIDEFIL
jgi:hypothetical protein